MPVRSRVGLAAVASLDTLAAAFWRAARGHRHRPDVARFAAHLDGELAALSADILAERSPDGRWTAFEIRDPKPRRILAPCFRDRVLHHALMAHMGPVLERSLVDDTYACRVGRGTLAAVRRAQEARETLDRARDFAHRERSLELKPDARIGRSASGVSFLGFRVTAGALRLSLRRKRRYRAARARWERAYTAGRIGARALQEGYAAALAVTAHADAAAWRRAELRARPPLDL